MIPCYEGLNETGVDVNEIWRKMFGFRVSIGLVPLILIVSWNETLLWRFERNQSWCQWDMNRKCYILELVMVCYPLSWLSHEMKPCYEGLKEIGVHVNEIWRKMLVFRISIGLLSLILIVLWNETLLWRFERNQRWCWWDMKENVIFWSIYTVVTPYFDCLMKWNPVMKVWKKSELMSKRYEGKCWVFW